MSALETLKHIYANRDEAAKAWKAGGGKVVGCFDETVPTELILAAGFMPFRYYGDHTLPTDTLVKYLYPLWKKHSLSDRQVLLGYTNSILDKCFRGHFDFVDYGVIPYTRKATLGIWVQLRDAKRAYPDLYVPEVHFLDRAITPGYDSSVFNRDRVNDFKAKLEDWSGKPITDDDLKAAIEVTNAQREAVARLNALRVQKKVKGSDALQAVSAGKFIMPADHTKLLNALCDEIGTAPSLTGPAIFVSGSPHDNTQLYELIEAEGGVVTGENDYWGAAAAYYPVSDVFPPLPAIGDMYHKKPGILLYPLQDEARLEADYAKAAGADATVVFQYANDNHVIWLVPDARDEMSAAGVPSTYFHTQPYDLGDGADIRTGLKSFFQTIGVHS